MRWQFFATIYLMALVCLIALAFYSFYHFRECESLKEQPSKSSIESILTIGSIWITKEFAATVYTIDPDPWLDEDKLWNGNSAIVITGLKDDWVRFFICPYTAKNTLFTGLADYKSLKKKEFLDRYYFTGSSLNGQYKDGIWYRNK